MQWNATGERSSNVSTIFAFGQYELDEARFELRAAGRRVSLQPKALRLLLYLVQQRGRTVSISELLRVLWPGQHVTAGSVKRAVRGARVALKERGDANSTLRSVLRVGYQLAPDVVVSERPALFGAGRRDLRGPGASGMLDGCRSAPSAGTIRRARTTACAC